MLFSPDFKWAANGSGGDPAKNAVSTAPIAKGLAEVLRRTSDRRCRRVTALPAGSRLDAAGEFPIIRDPACPLAGELGSPLLHGGTESAG